MASLPIIYTIQASDAPQHTDRHRKILRNLETENRIKGFTTLGVDDDLTSMTHTLRKDDMILILLTNELEKKREQVKKRVNMLKSYQPGLRVAEILVDNLIYDNDFITFPDDLHPIRNREDMDEVWINIGKNLKDMFPVKKNQVLEPSAKPFPLWSVYVVLGVFLFGGLLFITLPTASGEETEETFTTVPDLAGMSETEAVSLLLDAGLEAGQRRAETHDTVNRDLVIRSEPNAGESIEQGIQVTLIFSSGREQIPVPALAGGTLDQARAELEGAGLRVGQQRSEQNDEIEEGRVIRSDPGAGHDVDTGSQINLVISDGREQIPVPALAGVTLDQARAELEGAGLRVGQHRLEHSDEIEEGRVIRSDPGAGRDIDRGSQINLVISDGREQIRVPDLAGGTLDQARAELEGAGLRVGQQRSEHSNQVEEGLVIRSDPGAGRDVDTGSQINLVISDGRIQFPVSVTIQQEVIENTNITDLGIDIIPFLRAPSQVSPDNGTVFTVTGGGILNRFGPRRTNVSWNAVNGAARYGLEWVALSPGQACSQITDSSNLQSREDIQDTKSRIIYTRNTDICWRVYAVSTNDIVGLKSEWRQFRSN